MNLLRKIFSSKNKQVKVYLTLQIPKKDIDSSRYQNFVIIDCVELLDKYNYNLLKDSNLKRLEYIESEIKNADSDLLICDINLSIEEIIKISENIKSRKITISQIIVPNKIKRDEQLAKGLELYRNHSRWIDFYPGQVEDVYNNFEEKIKKLKIHFHQTETQIIEI